MALPRPVLVLMVRVLRHSSPSRGSILTAQNASQVGDLSETQAHPKKSTSRALSTAKDIWSFTEMLLKRLPDAVDINPAKIAFGIVKVVLQIKDVGRYSSHHCLTNYGY